MLSYAAAVLAALANATSNVLNRKAARDEPTQDRFRLRLIIDLLKRRLWLGAVAMMVVSFVLSAIALGSGQLAAVQTIIILELPITLILGAKALGGRLGRREWLAVAAMTLGVIGVLVCLDPRSGRSGGIPALDWAVGTAVNAGAVLGLFLAARVMRDPARQAALLGVACGLGYGLAAAFTKGMTEQFKTGGFLGALTAWQLYAAAAAGIVSTWLLENAFNAGRLTAAQPGITLLDPITATVWGVLVFHERVRAGMLPLLALAPLALLAGGVVLLSRSGSLRATSGVGQRDGEHGREAKAAHAQSQPDPSG